MDSHDMDASSCNRNHCFTNIYASLKQEQMTKPTNFTFQTVTQKKKCKELWQKSVKNKLTIITSWRFGRSSHEGRTVKGRHASHDSHEACLFCPSCFNRPNWPNSISIQQHKTHRHQDWWNLGGITQKLTESRQLASGKNHQVRRSSTWEKKIFA